MERRRRFNDPGSEIVWAALMVLDPGLQFQLLRELATLYADSFRHPRTLPDQVRVAVAALHEAAELLGRSPTVKEYRALRESLPELNLPAEANIRRWLGGGWNDCLARALLDSVADTDAPARAVGSSDSFKEEDVLRALRECTTDIGHPPTWSEYLAWVRRPDVLERPGLRPSSWRPFGRFFGGIRPALAAAGVIGENDARYSASGHVLALRFVYDDSDIRGALHRVARELGHSPSPVDYMRARQRLNEAALARGEVELLPTHDSIRKRHGTWAKALSWANLEPMPPRKRRWYPGEGRPRYTDDEAFAVIRRAWVEVGEPFTAAAYRGWRNRMMSTGETAVPALSTLEQRFGGWDNLRRLALGAIQARKGKRAQNE